MKRLIDQNCPCTASDTICERAATPTAPAVLVVDADPVLAELIEEWLAVEGCRVAHEPVERSDPQRRFDLVIVDLPHARQRGDDLLRRISSEQPGTPVLALSSSFFPGVHACGPVAHELGVSRVLAKPASRLSLIAAVRQLLGKSAE